jgi:hypothetical protein
MEQSDHRGSVDFRKASQFKKSLTLDTLVTSQQKLFQHLIIDRVTKLFNPMHASSLPAAFTAMSIVQQFTCRQQHLYKDPTNRTVYQPSHPPPCSHECSMQSQQTQPDSLPRRRHSERANSLKFAWPGTLRQQTPASSPPSDWHRAASATFRPSQRVTVTQ